jgi:hypothetical protein
MVRRKAMKNFNEGKENENPSVADISNTNVAATSTVSWDFYIELMIVNLFR